MKKFKYSYTYFILPYSFNMKHKEYIKSLMLDHKIKVHKFERFKDSEIYSFFKESILKNVFYSFDSKNEKKIEDFENFKDTKLDELIKLNGKDIELNSVLRFNSKDKEKEKNLEDIVLYLSEKYVTFFDLSLNLDSGGITSELKNSKEDAEGNIHEIINKNLGGINFEIESAQLIVFRTGISFICIKTVLPETNDINDVLDFNYKFKWLFSEVDSENKNIDINVKGQSLNSLKKKIIDITKLNHKKEKSFTWTDSFYTFSYLCVDNYFWDRDTSKEELEKLSNNYIKNYSSEHDFQREVGDLEEDNIMRTVNINKYTKIGLSKVSSNLICSGVDPYNFTVLPRIYETKYLYTYILSLYNKIFLSKYNDRSVELLGNNSSECDNILKKVNEFIQKIKTNEITLSETGSVYYNKLKKVLNLEENYNELLDKYNTATNYNQMKKTTERYKNIFLYTSVISNISFIVVILMLIF